MKIMRIINKHKKLCSFKYVVAQTKFKCELIKVDVKPPKPGYKRVEAIVKDRWNQLWTKHIDVKKDIVIGPGGTTY